MLFFSVSPFRSLCFFIETATAVVLNAGSQFLIAVLDRTIICTIATVIKTNKHFAGHERSTERFKGEAISALRVQRKPGKRQALPTRKRIAAKHKILILICCELQLMRLMMLAKAQRLKPPASKPIRQLFAERLFRAKCAEEAAAVRNAAAASLRGDGT